MDLQTRKIAFVQEFLYIEREEIIFPLGKLLKIELEDYAFKPMTILELNQKIDQSEQESISGLLTEIDAFLIEIKKWD